MTITGNQRKEGDFEVSLLCTNTEPIVVENTSTTATCNPITQVKFRYRLLQTNYCSLTAPTFYISTTNWFPAAASYNLLTATNGALTNNGYYIIEMQIQTADGTISPWSQPSCLKVSAPPATQNGLVNFGFSGSNDADNLTPATTTTCTAALDGEQRPSTGVCTDADGWLSNGGTLTNPTLVGIRLLNLADISFPNIFGGMQSHTIKIADVTDVLLPIPLGSYSGGRNYNATLNINSLIPCAYPGGAPATYFFTDKMAASGLTFFNGKTFSVALTAIDVCGKSYTKTGYFKIAPNSNWRTAQTTTTTTAASLNDAILATLNLYPNPVNDQLTIAYETPFEDVAEMRIVNMDGKTNRLQGIRVTKGINHIEQSTNDLPPGVYIVHIQQQGIILTRKFVKI